MGTGREAVAGALLGMALLGAAMPARAGLFDDEEARKQIAVERKRVDELNGQNQQLVSRLAKLEEALKNQALLDLMTQIEALKVELKNLRGQMELLNINIEGTQKRQRDMYVDLDTRLRRMEQSPAPAAPSPAAPAAPATGSTDPAAKPAAAAPAGPVAAAPATAAPPPSAAPSEAENRAYEAAQNMRRIGNYQGAIVGFQNFIKQYPKSPLASSAQYWIGDSYFNLRDFRLAISSQQSLLKAYPDSQKVPDAMLNIASSQVELGESAVARKTMEELVARYPVSEAADKAKRRLATIK